MSGNGERSATWIVVDVGVDSELELEDPSRDKLSNCLRRSLTVRGLLSSLLSVDIAGCPYAELAEGVLDVDVDGKMGSNVTHAVPNYPKMEYRVASEPFSVRVLDALAGLSHCQQRHWPFIISSHCVYSAYL